MKILFTAFKGVHNTSFQLVNQTENIFFVAHSQKESTRLGALF